MVAIVPIMTVAVDQPAIRTGRNGANSPSILVRGGGALVTGAGLQLYHHTRLEFAAVLLHRDAH